MESGRQSAHELSAPGYNWETKLHREDKENLCMEQMYVSVYAPTHHAAQEEKNEFYADL